MLRRHAPDVVSLVFGTLFAGFAAIWLLNATDVIDSQEAWLAGPAILIVAGVLGLVVALRPSEPAPPPVVPWAPAPEDALDSHPDTNN
jgi:apolipoprotein N-acyltransferase